MDYQYCDMTRHPATTPFGRRFKHAFFQMGGTLPEQERLRDHLDVVAWCHACFGDPGARWEERLPFQTLWFRDEADALLFKLRWG